MDRKTTVIAVLLLPIAVAASLHLAQLTRPKAPPEPEKPKLFYSPHMFEVLPDGRISVGVKNGTNFIHQP